MPSEAANLTCSRWRCKVLGVFIISPSLASCFWHYPTDIQLRELRPMATGAGLTDPQALQHLLQSWFAYTPNIKSLIEARHDLFTIAEGEKVLISKEPLMTVTRTANEYDVRGDRNRGYTVFSIDAEGLMLDPTCEQLRSFMVKSLNWGTLDKHVFRPLTKDRSRFNLAARNLRDLRVT